MLLWLSCPNNVRWGFFAVHCVVLLSWSSDQVYQRKHDPDKQLTLWVVHLLSLTGKKLITHTTLFPKKKKYEMSFINQLNRIFISIIEEIVFTCVFFKIYANFECQQHSSKTLGQVQFLQLCCINSSFHHTPQTFGNRGGPVLVFQKQNNKPLPFLIQYLNSAS